VKTFDQFYPFIMPDVMGCPAPTIDQYLLMSAREFCQRTKAWREWLDVFTADGTTNRFDHDLTSQQDLVATLRVLVNDSGYDEYKIKSARDLPKDWESGDSDDLDGNVVQIDNATEYAIYPLPTSGATFQMQVALKPSMTATTLPDALFDEWLEGVCSGAKARILAQSNQAWTDLNLSKYHATKFETFVSRAANQDFAQRSNKGTKVWAYDRTSIIQEGRL
jgi:hypothetical protein